MKKFSIKNNFNNNMWGGWITDTKERCLIKKRASVDKYIKKDINDYGDNEFSYDESTNVFSKKIIETDNDFLYFYFSVHDPNTFYNIGSFIRSIIRLMINYEPKKMKFIIDISKDYDGVNFKDQIEKFILSSIVTVIFTNVYILLSEELYNLLKDIPDIKNQCVNIENINDSNKILNNRTPFVIDQLNCHKFNLFNDFCSETQYISIEYADPNLPTNLASITHILPLYDNDFLKMKKTRFFVVCIEKVPNLERINELFKHYKLLPTLIVCIKDEHTTQEKINNQKIIQKCIEYGINYTTINFLICRLRETKPKNIVCIDLHPEAIIHKYNNIYKEFNDSFIFFGFESSGIPEEIIKMSTSFFQFPARSSINVIAATSILLSSIYK
jgi:hypothetical protein